jgi:hypothetical protein
MDTHRHLYLFFAFTEDEEAIARRHPIQLAGQQNRHFAVFDVGCESFDPPHRTWNLIVREKVRLRLRFPNGLSG